MACLDDETLFRLTERRLEGTELDRVRAHVDRCERCLELVAALMRSEDVPLPGEEATEVVRAMPSPGVMLDRYRIIEQAGAGAMGEVFVATDTKLKRKVALKLLRAEVERRTGGEALQARMWREAQALARLSHPNLVGVYDVIAAGDRIAIAMEFVAGGSARQWVAARTRTWREVLDVYLAAGRGLAAAHEAGLVHRDFKPDNVLVGADGKARVSDFGLAVAVDEPEERARASSGSFAVDLTETGEVLGTPAYMAAAQLTGAPASPLSDQFSFAVSLYEALHGERPFAASTREQLVREMRRRRVRPPPPKAAVPASVRAVLLRSLSPEPSERYPSMPALLAALERAARWTRRRKVWTVVSVLAAIFAFATLLRGLPPPQCPPPSKIFEGIWDPESRRRLATSLPGGEGKGRTAEEVAQFMDAYVAEWSSVYKTSCEATWRSGRQSERVFFVRMACLQGLAEELRIDVRAVEERGASPEGLMSRRRPSEACAASKVEEKIPPELGPRGE